MMKIVVIGNCQTLQIGLLLKMVLIGKANVIYRRWGDDLKSPEMIEPLIKDAAILLTNISPDRFNYISPKCPIEQFPDLQFSGFHPDQTYAELSSTKNKDLMFFGSSPASAIALWSYTRQIPSQEAVTLYNRDIFELLGYFSKFEASIKALSLRFSWTSYPFQPVMDILYGSELPTWSSQHPKLRLSASLVTSILYKLNISPNVDPVSISQILPDPLEREYAWGCFPPIANYLGIKGSWSIRHGYQVFLTINDYLSSYYSFLSNFPMEKLKIVDRDKNIFDLKKYDDLLGVAA